MDELSDATSIVSAWFSGDTESPTDSDAMLEWVVEQNTSILVVDDVHLLGSATSGAGPGFAQRPS